MLTGNAPAQTTDRVSIRVLPGYPLPERSIEGLDVRVERMNPPTRTHDEAVDRYFARVAAILAEHAIAGDWQSVIPDAPSIEITVEVNGRRRRLASAHVSLEKSGRHVVTERGMQALDGRSRDAVLARDSEAFRRQRLAFEQLLALTLEHVRSRLSP